jgi:glycosyltransferase involved in cell wall biosynthesis
MVSKIKKVSIIVPVYNIEKYIGKCLYSLVNQTLTDIQIVIVNDGSEDTSEDIIMNYREKYSDKITYIKKKNGGLSDARNVGMQYAIGEYIGCIDGDDYAEITMFEKMYAEAKKINADLVECDYYHEYPNKLIPKVGEIYKIKDILIKARVGAWNKIIKSEIIKKTGIQYPVGLRYEDVEYFYKMALYINKIGFVKEPLYYYVQRENSICHTQNEKNRDIFKIFEDVLTYYKEKELYDQYKDQLEYIYLRELLGGAFFRIVKMPDKNLRRCILQENWQKLNEVFPFWKRNTILQSSTALKDIYFRTINSITYGIYAVLGSILNEK